MNFSPLALVLSLTLASGSAVSNGEKPDNQINPYSVNLMLHGEKLQQEGHLVQAAQMFESALAVDPRNKNAFTALGKVAFAQGLPGKSIRFYREALNIDPNDLTALEAQGESMVAQGAVARAKQNLEKIKTICQTECPAYTSLSAVIAKGPPAIAPIKSENSANDTNTPLKTAPAPTAAETPATTSSEEKSQSPKAPETH
ncbi:MAG: tetratricopeptide repeat protein [Zymomonas mobilis subsp. pomaceae]|uniref:Uncharacterized protein n=1 Tax=Zymomonas mobilis subsp. pomaceae (strain ATCC 29192 / DSM 22645 / JCM 10191 / CCUG 17912 / NBRC 13757 / NCIMB 11200 / NRRL B-4491 / Barker I) TaxID=579138 RepID=F8ET39_ZYMMT|nr:tetratricopeptide repeat protein [Zymomonas mobilis]AEI36929.1 hypothetical protein Zymop_0025 [Zymomonas mobilis subsp. pomaceae ATCC 29192]MDX5948302.1 tetratricopeptide repeat protein [Zymomonas mobilis subsp. pomaceae]GEB89056.1 hypothetical protein ZMO02_06930 [Zymomonas mobilis subsp. pomaceae]